VLHAPARVPSRAADVVLIAPGLSCSV